MAFKMKGDPYKMGTHSTKKTMAYMKSPLEQTSFVDKVKSGVRAIKDNFGYIPERHGSTNKRNISLSERVMDSYEKNKKGYRDADRKKKMKK